MGRRVEGSGVKLFKVLLNKKNILDKINFNINDYLRFAFAGGWYILSLMLMYPNQSTPLIQKQGLGDSIGIILISLIVGSLIYSIHRAILFPHFYKIFLFIFRIMKKVEKDNSVFIPFLPSKLEMDMDIKRWQERNNPNSLYKNLVEWSSQIHFLYCTSWALLFALFTSNYIGGYDEKFQNLIETIFIFILFSSIISHYRNFRFDLRIEELEEK